jgi:hypothetical protein
MDVPASVETTPATCRLRRRFCAAAALSVLAARAGRSPFFSGLDKYVAQLIARSVLEHAEASAWSSATVWDASGKHRIELQLVAPRAAAHDCTRVADGSEASLVLFRCTAEALRRISFCEQVRQEISLLSRIHHAHICPVMGGACVTCLPQALREPGTHIALLLPSLKSHTPFEARSLPLPTQLRLMAEGASALAYVHGVAGRGIAFSPDALRMKEGHLQLLVKPFCGTVPLQGTDIYSPPEVLRAVGSRGAETSADVYSFAIVMLELFAGEGWRSVGMGPTLDTIPQSGVPEWLRALLMHCWSEDATARPTMQAVETRLRCGVIETVFHDEGTRSFWLQRFGERLTICFGELCSAIAEYLAPTELPHRWRLCLGWLLGYDLPPRRVPSRYFAYVMEQDCDEEAETPSPILDAPLEFDRLLAVDVERLGQVLPILTAAELLPLVELCQQGWFVGRVAVDAACRALIHRKRDGQFLVRLSPATGAVVLSTFKGKSSTVVHRRITRDATTGLYGFGSTVRVWAPTVQALVEQAAQQLNLDIHSSSYSPGSLAQYLSTDCNYTD